MKETEPYREVEETMQSLDGVHRAAPRPFLYARIKNRMDNACQHRTSAVWQPALAFVVVLVFFFNMFTIWEYANSQPATDLTETALVDEYYPSEYQTYTLDDLMEE
jgi:hypothetical protein